jgi:hypothetical protein
MFLEPLSVDIRWKRYMAVPMSFCPGIALMEENWSIAIPHIFNIHGVQAAGIVMNMKSVITLIYLRC